MTPEKIEQYDHADDVAFQVWKLCKDAEPLTRQERDDAHRKAADVIASALRETVKSSLDRAAAHFEAMSDRERKAADGVHSSDVPNRIKHFARAEALRDAALHLRMNGGGT